MKLLRALCVAALVQIGFAGVAHAQAPAPSDAAQEEGRERFKRGVELFRAGEFRPALIEFMRADEAAPSYRIQYNIGQTCLELQDYACGLRAFERYLAGGGKEVPKDRKALAEKEIVRLRKLVATVRVVASGDGAEVTVDDVAAGTTPLAEPILVGAGRHRVTLLRPGEAPVSRVVDVAGGDAREVSFVVAEPAAPARPARPALEATGTLSPPARPPPPEPRPSRAPFWGAVAATSVLAVSAGVTGALALSASSELEAATARVDADPAEIDRARSRTRTLSSVTDVLLVTSVVAGGATVLFWFTTRPRGSAAALVVGPGAAGVAGRF